MVLIKVREKLQKGLQRVGIGPEEAMDEASNKLKLFCFDPTY